MGSFNDEYQKLRRKRLEEQEEIKSSVPYQRLLNNSAAVTEKAKADDDIAPVTPVENNEEDKEERKWFEKGAFADGYQFGDLTKTFIASAQDLTHSISAGILGIGEKVVDAGAYVVGGVGGLLGADDFKDDVQEFIKKDLYNEEELAKKLGFGSSYDIASRILGIDEETQSVFGEKTDSLAQSGGQLLGTMALQGVGVPWWVTSGTTSFGSETENAFNHQGATYEQAGLSAVVSAGAEILTEKLFGGSGLGEKGLINLEPLTKGISSKVVKALADFGVDMAAEGSEEVVSSVFSRLGSALYKEESIGELLASEEAFDEYLESFIGGMALGGMANVGNVPNSIKTGTDYRTGLTSNEQAVVDKEFENRLAEAEQDGNKLSKKEQNELYEKVIKDLEKGYISTDTIEEVLGGEDYANYKSELKHQEDIDNELKELSNIKKSDLTTAQEDRIAELKAMKPNTELVNSLKFGINEKIRNALSSERNGQGSYLFESYNEQTRRGQAFEADLSKYDSKQAEVIKRAIDSGILNNTNRTHDFVDMVAKISADKGVLFDFANNAKLKESGFAVDGKFVNGYVTKDGITVNIDSNKALNSIVGHEITHVLEGTELYAALKVSITEYAKSKGDYQSRIDTLTKLYEGVEGADVSAELTADLVGDYLFTDEDFINHLSTSNRNVFQKIYDEIKYLYKVATAGSKQARELEKVKRAFDKAYREGGKASGDTKYSISNNVVDKNGKEYRNVVKLEYDVFNKVSRNGKAYVDYIRNNLIKEKITVFDNDGNMETIEFAGEKERVQKDGAKNSHPVIGELTQSKNELKKLVILNSVETAEISEFANHSEENNHKWLDKNGWDERTSYVMTSDDMIYPVTLYIAKARDGRNILYDVNVKIKEGVATDKIATSLLAKQQAEQAVRVTTPSNADIITQEKPDVKRKFSLSSDSDGKKLTKEQSEYFKDSKMRDDNGNLKVMYHGSQDAGFHTFDANMSDDDTSFFFVDRNDVAASYSGTSETYAPKAFKTVEDANKFFAEIDATEYEVVENNGKYTLLEDGDEVATSDNLAEIYEEWRDWSGLGYGDANYKVYLNLTNPLEIDAEGRNWNNISREFSQEVADRYHSLSADERAALTSLAEWGEYGIFKDEMLEAMKKGITVFPANSPLSSYEPKIDENVRLLSSAYKKLGGATANLYDAFSIASENFSEESIKQFAVKQMNTRDYAQKAKAEGYDGVIFKNIHDNGGYSNGDEGASTVAIAFESNQIKSVANDKPTADKDIRYSLSEDSEGRKLSEKQISYFGNSTVRDDNGKLLAVKHGTNEDFHVFDFSRIGKNGKAEGYGFYFSDDTEITSRYGSTQKEVYLNITKPLLKDKRTVKKAELVKFVDALINFETSKYEDDGLTWQDSFISNYINTYEPRISRRYAVQEFVNQIWQYDDNDVDLIYEIANGSGKSYSSESMREFYDVLTETIGYDGIIAEWVNKDGASKVYVTFNPEQSKYINNVNPTFNEDMRYSLSDTNEAPTKQYGSYNVYGKDVKLDIAPVGVAENATTTEDNSVDMGDEFAPVVNSYTIEQEIDEIGREIEALVEESTDLYNKGEEAKAMELVERINELSTKDRQLREQAETLKAQEEADRKAYIDSLAETEPPVETERAYSEADTTPLDDKTLKVLTRNVRNVLSSMPKENKAIREVIEKYIASENPKKSELFRELKDKFGDKYEYHRYSDIAEAKKVLRTYKFNVSDQVKSDIADFRDYKKSHNVRTSKNALSVDVLYEELSGLYPGLFPADITNETDRFERISEVSVMPAAEWVKVAELSDNEIMQAADFIHNSVTEYRNNSARKAAEANAKAYIDDVAPSRAKEITENVSDTTLNYQGIYREAPIKTVKERLAEKLSNVDKELINNKRLRAESFVDFNREIARLQEEYNSKANKNTQAANDILRRIERLQTMKNNVDADYEKRISDLEAKKAKLSEESRTGTSATEQAVMRAELHLSKIDNIRAKFAEKGLDFDKTLKNAKDLSTFATVDNTPQRVMEKSLGYKAGQILADETVNKVAQNETEGIKWLNSYTDRKNGLLAQISKQYNIKPGSKESAAAQMYAEGFYVNKDNEIIKYGDNELAADFPNAKVRENIKGLARDTRIRKIYDDTLDMINDSRARNAYPEIQKLDNYFLHFRAMDDTFSQLGLPFNPNDIRAKDLPTDLNGVTADLKPGQPYFASSMHREGIKTSYDLLGGLERYLSSAKNQIYHIDDIQTLRALRNHIADTYGQAKGLEGLDALSEAEVQEKIKQVFNAHLSTFAKFLNEEANIIAGKTALIDRGFEGIFGRRAMTFMDTLNKQVGANMVGFNVSSSMTNFLAPVQAFAKTNKVAFVKGFAQTVSNKLGSIAGKTDGFAEKSPVMIRRKGADRFYRTPYQKLGDAGYVLMSAVDDISTEIIARAKYNELTSKGMGADQAHFETDKWVSRLMGDRSLGQMPQLYNSKTLGIITKFQLEVRNQLDSQFYDTIQEAKADNAKIENALARNAKTAAKVTSTFAQLAIAQHLFGKAFESIAGYNPAFDIIEVIMTALGFDDDEESEDTALDNIQQGFLALLEDLPYTSTLTGGRIPISSALPITELIKGEDQYGNEKSRLETLGEIAPYYILPGGYGQIKKTIQGLDMFSDDHPIAGSYTDSGKLRFPVDETFGNVAQAAIFGQYASQNARDYFDNDIAPLNEKQTQEFIDVDMDIHDYWDYREGLSEYKTLAEKADYINSLDLTNEQKNILINNIADRKEDIDMSDYDNYGSFEEFDYANKYPEKYEFWKQNGISYEDYVSGDDDTKAAYNWAYENPDKFTLSKAVASDVVTYRQYTKALNDIKADKDKYGNSISGSRKAKVVKYINNLDADYGAKIILFKSEYPADDTYNVEIVNYLNSRDDISYEEMETILKELGFNVDSNGRITWD